MELIHEFLENLHIPTVNVLDVVEILIIAVLMYVALVWVKETHAWALFRGVMVIAIFVAIAALLNMTTILWIARQLVSIFLMVMVVVLQPELRKALESLGQKNFFSQILPFDSRKQDAGFTDKTIAEIVKACVEMGKARTGALIVIENKESLAEYERTGIDVDGVVSSQLLINIFEKNTPLHDGAVVVRGDRITSATCYLPLSDNRTISKELGTRHRAGLGIAEATDSMTVIVSEETGRISVAFMGQLYHGLSADELKEQLGRLQDKAAEEKKTLPLERKVQMKNKLTNNIGLKIGSLLAAIVIWLAVVNINDPNTSVTFYNVPVTIQNADAITSQGKIYEIEDNSDVVNRVTLYGPRSVLENVEKSNVVAVADMKNLSSVNTVSIDFSTTTNFNQITDIRASSENVKVTIETRKTVQMVLRTQVIGDAPEGYVVGSVTTDQNLVRVIGPESLINRISTAAITIDMNTMSGVTTDITTSATVRLYDDAGEEVTGSTLTKNPENVIATVNILPTKEVPLKFEVSGTPANGYAFSGTVTSDPEAVTVYGTKAAIAALSSITIPADELNITGQRENLVTRINIAEYVPDTVTLVSEDSAEVTVTVDIEPLETKEIKIDLHSIEIDDLPENMTCEFDTSNGDVITVTLVGIKKDLATLNATNILTVFKVNEWMAAQGITKLPEGNYPVTLEFDLPEDVTLQSPVKVTMSAVNNPVDEENEGEGNEEQNNPRQLITFTLLHEGKEELW